MAFINLSRKYVFLATARAASTSLYDTLEYISKSNKELFITHRKELPDLYHIGLREFIKNYPQFRDFYIFSIVRDPYTRLVSSWNEFRDIGKHVGWSDGIKKCKNFYYFLDTFDKNISRFSIHFRPQYLQLNYFNKKSLNNIMYYEKIDDDFSKVMKILYGKSYHINSLCRPTAHFFYSKLIKKKILECVYKNYSQDIKNYYNNYFRYK